MKVFNYRDVPPVRIRSRSSMRWLITEKDGARNFVMRYVEVEPGDDRPPHVHPWEHEIFVLKGRGVVKGGGKEVEFGAGDVLFIPPNEPHEFVNIGDEKLVFLCMIPAGVNLKEIKTLPER